MKNKKKKKESNLKKTEVLKKTKIMKNKKGERRKKKPFLEISKIDDDYFQASIHDQKNIRKL